MHAIHKETKLEKYDAMLEAVYSYSSSEYGFSTKGQTIDTLIDLNFDDKEEMGKFIVKMIEFYMEQKSFKQMLNRMSFKMMERVYDHYQDRAREQREEREKEEARLIKLRIENFCFRNRKISHWEIKDDGIIIVWLKDGYLSPTGTTKSDSFFVHNLEELKAHIEYCTNEDV